MLLRHLVLLPPWLGLLGCSSSAQTAPVRVTRAAFANLRWLEGAWRGTGSGVAAFYEQYTFANDTTIVARTFADSTLMRVNDSSVVQLRRNTLVSEGGDRRYVAVALSPDSVAFAPDVGARNAFTWRRLSASAWLATLTPTGGASRPPVVYRMERIPGPPPR